MKKVLCVMSAITVFSGLAFAQINLNSYTNVKNGNNAADVLTVTNQYTGGTNYCAIVGNANLIPGVGNGGLFNGGCNGVIGAAQLNGPNDRYGVVGEATTGAAYGSGKSVFGVTGWAYNSNATKTGVFGGVWNDNGTVPANQYGVVGQAIGTPSGGIKSYGVYCMGNGAATGTWTWASDQKLKTNMQPVGSVLAKIKQLNAITYNYDVAKYPKMGFDPNKKYGFTAQNVEAVFPDLVRNDVCPGSPVVKDGKIVNGAVDSATTYKGVDYIGLIPILLNAIQEQQAQIDALTAKLK